MINDKVTIVQAIIGMAYSFELCLIAPLPSSKLVLLQQLVPISSSMTARIEAIVLFKEAFDRQLSLKQVS